MPSSQSTTLAAYVKLSLVAIIYCILCTTSKLRPYTVPYGGVTAWSVWITLRHTWGCGVSGAVARQRPARCLDARRCCLQQLVDSDTASQLLHDVLVSNSQAVTPSHLHTHSAALRLRHAIFNNETFRGQVTLATPFFLKVFKGSCPDWPWKRVCQIWSP